MNCFPFEDPVIVVRVKGAKIRESLENSVYLVPALEGRYCQVSGLRFCYNTTLPPGSRVRWVEIAGQPLDNDRGYTMATRGYMGRGKDGFLSLLVRSEGGEAEEIVSEENGVLISMILRQYFMSLSVLRRWRRWGPSMGRHWGDVHEKLHAGEGATQVLEPEGGGHKHSSSGDVKHHDAGEGEEGEETEDDGEGHDEKVEEGEEEGRRTYLARSVVRRWMRAAGIKHGDVGTVEDYDMGESGLLPGWTRGIAPRLEGRIVIESVEVEAQEN